MGWDTGIWPRLLSVPSTGDWMTCGMEISGIFKTMRRHEKMRLNRNIARNNIFVSGILFFGVKVSAELSNILPLVPYKLFSVPVSIVQCPKIFCQISQV
jgi:hypothetical protein